ncbi:small subunit ribosomal protein S6 [Entomoplasma freundtii]|uniref:Small ribosomal subunit protein bS6 n=1 Tax=Entomoplasma freundtii TaxID=74700 RepID=A0A2K8NU56_9MOLU|nr:30S ribosomal protein S6 [Entomoplasma freundtii]ATZ16708.1 30S ribosomal protein S6 [Entomoplasma freundtii]TDY58125.1 small subunit ribosomal protein S6 [Entomoplasma freundtii]
MKRKYEVMYILDQDVKEPQEMIKKLNQILSADGEILESAEWGLMDFAYEINHKKKGYYVVVIANTTPEAVAEFKRITKNDRKNVVRTMVMNTENVQHYVASTKLSKTDMTKYDEERREAKKPKFKKFNKDFKRNFNNNRDGQQTPNTTRVDNGPSSNTGNVGNTGSNNQSTN